MTTNDLLTRVEESKPGIHDFELGGQTVPVVDARELHAFLQVGKDFSTWIKDRIAQYGFEQGRDFEVFPGFGENPSGARARLNDMDSEDAGWDAALDEEAPFGKHSANAGQRPWMGWRLTRRMPPSTLTCRRSRAPTVHRPSSGTSLRPCARSASKAP